MYGGMLLSCAALLHVTVWHVNRDLQGPEQCVLSQNSHSEAGMYSANRACKTEGFSL